MIHTHEGKVVLDPVSSAWEISILCKILYKDFLFKMIKTKFYHLKNWDLDASWIYFCETPNSLMMPRMIKWFSSITHLFFTDLTYWKYESLLEEGNLSSK